ncbi:MAG: DUF177 domain-containing protein [Comamonadaceae bacterium]|nr:MAG: DUF177 domain-containing protein [Comamonadaceae bacterium]
MKTFAQEGEALTGTTPLKSMERLSLEAHDLPAGAAIDWQAQAELRASPAAEDVVWLHLKAHTVIPLTCQRCMTAVATPLNVEQLYRFVDTEEIAMAEDDESEEDLLVMEPQFDLQALIEDELVMALPLVPMHEHCPSPQVFSAIDEDFGATDDKKPNPFDVLAQLKSKKSQGES